MSAITNLWRQLVERRLWPVAILLIAALVAVPLALAKQPQAAPPDPVAPTVGRSENALATEPIVAQVSAIEQSRQHRVLGSAKNPFGVSPTDTGSAAPASSTVVNRAKPTPSAQSSDPNSSGGSPSPGSGSTPTPVPPVATPAPKRYSLYDLTVRFGDAGAESLARSTLKRLQPLPSAETPVLIYLGVMKDGKTAVFLLDHGVVATGDGSCKPDPETCETIQLRAGDTEFFDIKDATDAVVGQYELDLVKIHKGATASAARANASYAGSKSGRRLLKARSSSDGPTRYRWDAQSGTLAMLARADNALVARSVTASAGLGRG